jgi:hypothetical protein
MSKPNFKNYLSAFRSINGILAVIGVLIPAFSIFTNYSPPLFKEASVLTAAIAAIIIIVTFYYNPSPKKRLRSKLPYLVRLSIKAFVISIALFIVYLVLFNLCTVETPGGTERFQIGFWKYDWGLTNIGLQIKAKYPDKNPQYWIMYGGWFYRGGPNILWKTWTIFLSGIIIILVFILTFVLWTLGWALLAKQKLIK